ncbi:hypothetical protein [Dermatophilus congolensis]|uniref:hypothetical protein n=1 Tax=Dermatophilus congolensis TaxID=1863 RepID=UPI001AAE2E20|nr:hypothetical protein [Dermatophilus congolensis]MBO3143269.1 hypothetical protein [Dermatophilus congolensis]MBO3152256.1 hypothetical protein [Dermatophilus congolensis]MBO3160732.1 hypothetical protein [Dermatophilus congolensis]MBO3163544.1 hypothetical protein [Dermatophilus congolensis]MBO3177090.1 hypothetical protein [Dermatophilus congolensis]
MNHPPHDPVPESVRGELERLITRWASLPYDQALACVQDVWELATSVAASDPTHRDTVPALEESCAATPAAVMQVLTAVIYDQCAAHTDKDARDQAASQICAQLSELRSGLPSNMLPLGQ